MSLIPQKNFLIKAKFLLQPISRITSPNNKITLVNFFYFKEIHVITGFLSLL